MTFQQLPAEGRSMFGCSVFSAWRERRAYLLVSFGICHAPHPRLSFSSFPASTVASGEK